MKIDFTGEGRVIFWLQSPDDPVNTMKIVTDGPNRHGWMSTNACLFRWPEQQRTHGGGGIGVAAAGRRRAQAAQRRDETNAGRGT